MRLLDKVRHEIRSRHYSYANEKSYVQWVKHFILFHRQAAASRDMGAVEIEGFLSWLATGRNVAAVTQNQALNALVFLCRQALEIDWGIKAPVCPGLGIGTSIEPWITGNGRD